MKSLMRGLGLLAVVSFASASRDIEIDRDGNVHTIYDQADLIEYQACLKRPGELTEAERGERALESERKWQELYEQFIKGN
jgi:hypothetical protein